MPKLVSAVGGGDFDTPIDIHTLVNSPAFAHTSYQPEEMSFITLRVEENSPSLMLYSTGKYNIAGGESISDLKDTRDSVLSILNNEFRYEIRDPSFEVRYLTFKHELNRELELKEICHALGDRAKYEPESNPAVVYRPTPNSSSVFSIYRTGNIILTGVSSKDESEELFDNLLNRLQSLFV